MKLRNFVKKEAVLLTASFLAALSFFLVDFDPAALAGSLDFRVLGCLFCLMLAVAGFQDEGMMKRWGNTLAARCADARRVVFAMELLTFFTSMLMTNDVALITFVPLTLAVLGGKTDDRTVMLAVVLQTVAANVGSAVTPVGNPQNLFLFVHYGLSFGQFFSAVWPVGLVGAALCGLGCLLIRPSPVRGEAEPAKAPDRVKIMVYAAWFFLAAAAVGGRVNYWVVLLVAGTTALFVRPRLFARVDYSLLLTFVAFFLFVGNISRYEPLRALLTAWLGRSALFTSALASQIVSNVPAAVLLSSFTGDFSGLLRGVDAGGCGTLIASLASVISYKLFAARYPGKTLRYLGLFTAVNAVCLGVLLAACLLPG